MRLRLLSLVAALAFLSVTSLQARATDIFVLSGSTDGFSNTNTGFGTIDSSTGTYTQISSAVGGATNVSHLAWNAAISAFYVTENFTTNTTLRTLSTSGTLSSSIGTVGTSLYGMAYRSATSTLSAYDLITDDLGTISTVNGAFSNLADSSFVANTPTGGRFTMHNDAIYATASQGSGQGQFGTYGSTISSGFSQIGSNSFLFKDMVLASDGTTLYGLYGNGTAGQQKLYTIDTTSGVTSFVTNISGTGLGNYFYGAAAGITVVPEPSTYALATIATGVMVFSTRRFKRSKS